MIETLKTVKKSLLERITKSNQPREVLRSPELKRLYRQLPNQPIEERTSFGQQVNSLKADLEEAVSDRENELSAETLGSIDVTAPRDVNAEAPRLLPTTQGTLHPLNSELELMLDIYARMGFYSIESREIDDDFHMFGSLNFPEGHPARDDYDTFVTEEKDKQGRPFIAPAHTSTMQNRVLSQNKQLLEQGDPIAFIIPGRVFRNEDVDARHEHTFHQLEAVYVDKGVHAGMLIATLRTFFKEYYRSDVKIKTQPYYFPFTEPSFEFAASCIFCEGKGCSICSHTGWIELGGCGMIHPNVLKMAGIDPDTYTGFAWGFGLERMAMIKYGIEDVRHFHSGKLDFLRQF